MWRLSMGKKRLRVPWADSWPDTSHALNALFADTTFRPALFAPPSAAKLKTPTWSPAVVDVDFALPATAEEAPAQICLAALNLGNESANCLSFPCDTETYINNVPVVTCHCPKGKSVAGTPVPAHTAFAIQAGQGNKAFCAEHPVALPLTLQ
jgi:hypothetical protein